ncbi:MAG: PTS sugar transporter subunit IIA [Alphaproteobacteria bacterium]|jgi:PTS system nitrogen regulatory IIA component
MNIADIITPADVFCDLKASGKRRLLVDLATIVASRVGLDGGVVFEALWEREKLASTGVGRGVAIPHGRMQRLPRIAGLFVKLQTPVDFEAPDDVPVDLVFLLLTPAEAGADHLKALARISRLLRHAGTCERLRAATSADALYSLLTEPPAGTRAA